MLCAATSYTWNGSAIDTPTPVRACRHPSQGAVWDACWLHFTPNNRWCIHLSAASLEDTYLGMSDLLLVLSTINVLAPAAKAACAMKPYQATKFVPRLCVTAVVLAPQA